MKLKLYSRLSTELKWEFLYSRMWPEEPKVEVSIYADHFAMQKFEREMEYLLRYPVTLTNPEKAIELIGVEYLKDGKFYEFDCEYTVTARDRGYTITML